MSRHLRVVLTVAVAVAGSALAGCASSSPSASGGHAASSPAASSSAASSPAASSSPAATSSAVSTSSPSPAATPGGPLKSGRPVAAARECRPRPQGIRYTRNKKIRNGALAGMSHADSVITFTNSGPAPCRTGGYPGVAALDKAGHQIRQAARHGGGATTIVLDPGRTASALLSANTASCTKPSGVYGLLVTAPNNRKSIQLPSPGTLCVNSIQIGTLQRGDTGGLKLG